MASIRKHLSYANAMATLAVFISLGGGAIAALRIPANSVGTRQLQRSAVTGVKVKPGSLTGVNIKQGSLLGADIKPGSLSPSMLPRIGLGNLLGVSGTATNNTTIALKAGECDRYAFTANGAQLGDTVILQGSDIAGLEHAIEAGPSIPNANQLNVTVCADTTGEVNQIPGAVQLRFDTLR